MSTHITTLAGLQAMKDNMSEDYILDNDIDATGFAFVPVGTLANKFNGSFDGQGYTITGLTVNTPISDFAGLFGYTSGAAYIRNVTLVNVNVLGQDQVGALVGFCSSDTAVTQCRSSGSVNGRTQVGGLIGAAAGGGVPGSEVIGRECSSTVDVTATGDKVGGLIGVLANGAEWYESKSYGDVVGNDGVGGLVGATYLSSDIENCYSKSSVNGNDAVGGLCGENGAFGPADTCNITLSYSMGAVTGNTNVGGFIGKQAVAAGSAMSHWDIETSGQAASAGGAVGHTTAAMQLQATYAGWDFVNIWDICDPPVTPYPWLQWQEIICGTIPTAPTDLLCEQTKNPTDVTDPKPEFSAIFHGG